MRDRKRVDLIFPRSGQVVAVYVPDAIVDWVARRNLQVLLSLYNTGALRDRADRSRGAHLYPS